MAHDDSTNADSSSNGQHTDTLLSTVERLIREEAVPHDALERALETVRRFDVPPAVQSKPRRRISVAATIAAVMVMGLLLMSLRPRPRTAWAEVVTTVQNRPWIHGVATDPEGQQEFWFNKQAGLRIFRSAEQVSYSDHRQGICFTYDPGRKTIYRHRVFTDHPDLASQYRRQIFALWDKALPLLFAGRHMVEFPDGPREFVSQSQRTVTGAGRQWIEYSCSFADGESGRYTEWTFRVDPQTHLPRSQTIRSTHPDLAPAQHVVEYSIDFPEQGPGTVFEVFGVPATHGVIDLVPTQEADRIIAGYKQARVRFDDYYAVVVTGITSREWWRASQLYRVWRSGLRWRIEQVLDAGPLLSEVPDNAGGQDDWWAQRATQLSFRPVELSDGKDVYRYRSGRWEKARPLSSDNPYSSVPHAMPEFFGRPFLHALYPGAEVILNPELSEGPAGTVWLSAWRPGHSMLQTEPNVYRYQIDPAMSHLCMSHAWIIRANGEDTVVEHYLIDDVAQSPKGHWYPKTIRRRDAARGRDGARLDQVYRYVLDFNASNSEDLFDAAQ